MQGLESEKSKESPLKYLFSVDVADKIDENKHLLTQDLQ